MSQKAKKEQVWIAIFVGALFVGLLFWANYRFAKAEPGGSDFLYRWLPTRLVAFEGYDNPYSLEVEYQVELAHLGRAHQEGEPMGIFSYPYYTMGVFLPVAVTSNFLLARSIWMTFMELAHLGIIYLAVKMVGLKPAKILGGALIFFALFPADFAQALVDGNPSSLAAFFAVAALFFIYREKDVFGGVFLALSTIKPQLVILFFAVVWVWAFSRQRWKIISGSAVTLIVLMGVSFILQPSWFAEFINDLTTYTGMANPSTPQAILSYWMPASVASGIAWGLTIFSLLTIIYLVKSSWGKEFSSFFWAASLIFVLMPLTGITSAKSNYVAMMLTVVLILSVAKEKGMKEIWLSALLLIWIPLSWIFLFAGRGWVLNGTLIYFLDFYPLPVLLLVLSFLAKPFEREKELEAKPV